MLTAAIAAAAIASHRFPVVAPKPAPPVYATHNYALMFETPPGLTYCPLPKNWVGSDHGTTLFLVPPRRCGGAGLPSSSRWFEPNVRRIEVYYGYRNDDAPAQRSCRMAGRLQFVGQMRPLCKGREGRMVTLEAWATYEASSPADVSLRLVTTSNRVGRDSVDLSKLAKSLRPCRVQDASPPFGAGAPCPNVPWF
jgi:hypothetical protein